MFDSLSVAVDPVQTHCVFSVLANSPRCRMFTSRLFYVVVRENVSSEKARIFSHVAAYLRLPYFS